jgi:two-component system LytT family response regulator
MSVRTAIVDDEPLARKLLRRLLAGRPEIEVLAEYASGAEAVAGLRRDPVELLLLDVRMPEMDGFQLLSNLPEADPPAVVFVTAHDEYTLRAFEVAAVDYLLKPVDERRLHGAVDRALERMRGRGWRQDLERLLAVIDEMRRGRHLERLPIRAGERIMLLPVDEVHWFEAAGNHVRVHAGGRTHIIRDSLAELGRVLDPTRFMRISRSATINLGQIREIWPWFQREYEVVLTNGDRVRSTKSYRDGLDRLMRRSSGG